MKQQEATRLLILASRGDAEAAASVMPLIYGELYRLAQERVLQRPGDNKWHLLSPTELVHEAYMHLMNGDVAVDWQNRQHFFAVAAMVMRRLALDDLRHHGRLKRGDGWARISLQDAEEALAERSTVDPLELADALRALAKREPRQAMIAEWRVFVGLPHAHIARLLNLGERTVQAEWARARVHLARELRSKTR